MNFSYKSNKQAQQVVRDQVNKHKNKIKHRRQKWNYPLYFK